MNAPPRGHGLEARLTVSDTVDAHCNFYFGHATTFELVTPHIKNRCRSGLCEVCRIEFLLDTLKHYRQVKQKQSARSMCAKPLKLRTPILMLRIPNLGQTMRRRTRTKTRRTKWRPSPWDFTIATEKTKSNGRAKKKLRRILRNWKMSRKARPLKATQRKSTLFGVRGHAGKTGPSSQRTKASGHHCWCTTRCAKTCKGRDGINSFMLAL